MKQWHFVLLALALALTACAQDQAQSETGAFTDTFDTPGNWHTISDPEVEIAYTDGGLGIHVKVLDRVAWTVAGRQFRDGIVSVDATPIGGPDDNAYGLIIRHQDDRNFYRFEISSDGYFAVQAPKGALGWEYLVEWTPSPAIKKGRETNHLKVVCQGNTMTFYANDVELTRVEDDRYAQGDIGLIAGTFYAQAGTHILFDNLTVEPLNE